MSLRENFLARVREDIRQDLPAGVVVFFVAVPLCLGVALASGVPLFSGIIAGVVGGIVVGFMSNSAVGVSGPAAGLAVIVLNAIASLGCFENFLAAVVLAGAFQIVLGLIRAGAIAYFFPMSVIKGMLAAIGIIIVLKQVPHALGYDRDYETDLYFWNSGLALSDLVTRVLSSFTLSSIVVFLLAISVILVWSHPVIRSLRVSKYVQSPFAAVIVGIAYQLITSDYFPSLSLKAIHLVNVPDVKSADSFFSSFSFLDFSAFAKPQVWTTALTISVVASLETLLSVEATDKLDSRNRTTDKNRELMAQGVGNMVSGFLGGLPITQVILRSSANVQSGAVSKLSTILHGVLILLCVTLVPFLINLIPLAVLAAILIVIGFKLAKPSSFVEIYRQGWSQFAPFVATVVGVVFTDLLTGVAIGMGVVIAMMLKDALKHSHSLQVERENGAYVVKLILAEKVFFLNKGTIKKELNKIPSGSRVIIDGSRCITLDHDVQELIREFKKSAPMKQILVDIKF